jgi:hypothetical protein
MKKTAAVLVISLALPLAASGCRKTSFGAGCEKSAELTAPWTELGLPLDEKKARVCASSATELKLRSYSWTSIAEAHPAFEQVLVAGGYTKDRCTGPACYYDKDGNTVSVHPIDFKVKDRSLITVVMAMRPDSTGKRTASPETSRPSKP